MYERELMAIVFVVEKWRPFVGPQIHPTHQPKEYEVSLGAAVSECGLPKMTHETHGI